LKVNKLALLALIAGLALLCLFGYSLTQELKVTVTERLPVYNLQNETIGYVVMTEEQGTVWSGIGLLSLIIGLTLTAYGACQLKDC